MLPKLGKLVRAKRLKDGRQIRYYENAIEMRAKPPQDTSATIFLKVPWEDMAPADCQGLCTMLELAYQKAKEIDDPPAGPDDFERSMLEAAQKFVNDIQEANRGG
jgi:hypothetical protein